MTRGTIQNKESFLGNISKALGRERRTSVMKPEWKHTPQYDVLKNATQDELTEVLKKQCENIHTTVREIELVNLSQILTEVIADYQGQSVVTWDDPRFAEFGLTEYLNKELPNQGKQVWVWEPKAQDENLAFSKSADVGITFSDRTLAESATVVLFSSAEKGRAVSLLPATYIAIIPKSTIVPRMTQVASEVHKQIQQGKQVASCVNFISGPSNSADIEMQLIVGVHGPVKATYIIVKDK